MTTVHANGPRGVSSAAPETFDEMANRFRGTIRYGNPVKDRNPIALLAFFAAISVAVSIVGLWQVALVAVALEVLLAAIAGVLPAFLRTWWKIVAFVGSLLFVTRAAFAPGQDVFFHVGAIAVSAESIQVGLDFAGTVMAICGAVVLLFAAVSAEDLLLSFEQVGMTSRATYVVLASFQAITDLGHNAKIVMDAQRARGVETTGSPLVRVRAFVPVLAPVFLTAITSTEERAVALDARAFNARAHHTHLRRLRRQTLTDRALLTVAVLIVVAAVIGKALPWQ